MCVCVLRGCSGGRLGEGEVMPHTGHEKFTCDLQFPNLIIFFLFIQVCW